MSVKPYRSVEEATPETVEAALNAAFLKIAKRHGFDSFDPPPPPDYERYRSVDDHPGVSETTLKCRDCAELGLTVAETAARLNISKAYVYQTASRYGFKFKRAQKSELKCTDPVDKRY